MPPTINFRIFLVSKRFRNMRLPCLFIFAVLFAATPLPAQSNWRSGKLMTTEGVEEEVRIDDRNWTYHFNSLRVKPLKTNDARRVSLKELQSFTVNGRRYVVRDITINSAPRDPRHLVAADRQGKTRLRAALLVLVDGPLTLYEYADVRTNSHFFISHAESDFEYLRHNRYAMADRENRSGYQENNGFRGQLARAMASCPRMRFELSGLGYRRDELLEKFENYYNCGRQRSGYWHEPPGNAWLFGLDVGAHLTTPDYGVLPNDAFRFSELSSVDPTFGLHAKYRFGGRYGSVAVKFTAMYHAYGIERSVDDPEVSREDQTAVYNYVSRERSVHLQLGPRVVLVPTRYPVFLESTIEYHRILEYSEFQSRAVTDPLGTVVTGSPLVVRNQGALGLSIGAGLIAGHFSLSLRGTAVRRAYPDRVLNLYRVSLLGSYDF